MAEPKKSFPMLPAGHWWALRRKFKQSIPGVVTTNYLATVLDMGVDSARANVYPFLRVLGIIDDDGKTTERAKHWRDDIHYAEVCKKILAEVYPDELLQAVPDPRGNRDGAKRWFANHTGAGENACARMAALYTVLVEADPDGGEETQKVASAKPKKTKVPEKKTPESPQNIRQVNAPPDAHPSAPLNVPPKNSDNGPDVSLNLQIHISADASPDQIEQIFAAMAKHIYKRG